MNVHEEDSSSQKSPKKFSLFFFQAFLSMVVSGLVGSILGVAIPEIGFGLGKHICAIIFIMEVLPVEALIGSLIAVLSRIVLNKKFSNFRILLATSVLVFILNMLFVELDGCF